MIIEDQTTSPRHHMIGSSPTSSPASMLFLFLSLPVCRRSCFLRGGKGRSQII